MSDQDGLEESSSRQDGAAIGVGMGGSCPVCRAPVDLGQEFCLECGSPIRFTPRQRRPQRPGERGPGRAPAPAPVSARGGFPWVPFLVVLALIGGGVAFALVDGDDQPSRRSGGTGSTEPALPTITNATPETSTTETTTVPTCPTPTEGAAPGAADDPASGALDAGEQIPSLGGTDATSTAPGGAQPPDPFADPSVPTTGPSTGTPPVTVDESGNLCGTDDGSDTAPADATDPTDPATSPGTQDPADPLDPAAQPGAGTDTGSTGGDTSAEPSGDWPAGKDGWTVVVAGYDTQERAAQRAADLQEQGFDDGGVLFSSDFRSLCPGIHVVFSGTFERRAQAEARRRELAATGSYVREIRRTGPAATGCRPAR